MPNNTIMVAVTVIAVVAMTIIALAPLFGFSIPETIWGIAVGTLAAIAGNAVAQSKERYVWEQPKGAKAEIVVKSTEE